MLLCRHDRRHVEQHEVIAPSLVEAPEDLVIDLAAQVGSHDIGAERSACWDHFEALRPALAHGVLLTSSILWPVHAKELSRAPPPPAWA
jgi:hypothetical protein